MWATLAARDYRTPNSSESQQRRAENNPLTGGPQLPNQIEHQFGHQDPKTSTLGGVSTRRLSPHFAEWLMGFPIGWSASRALATPRFQSWQHLHGELCNFLFRNLTLPSEQGNT